jgi:hypothetical protein
LTLKVVKILVRVDRLNIARVIYSGESWDRGPSSSGVSPRISSILRFWSIREDKTY